MILEIGIGMLVMPMINAAMEGAYPDWWEKVTWTWRKEEIKSRLLRMSRGNPQALQEAIERLEDLYGEAFTEIRAAFEQQIASTEEGGDEDEVTCGGS